MHVLLSDASSLASRQAATILAWSGHEVEALAPTWFCLDRFTAHVRRLHLVPPYGLDPLGWLDHACAVLRSRPLDVLFPT